MVTGRGVISSTTNVVLHLKWNTVFRFQFYMKVSSA